MARGLNKVTLIGNLGADPEVRYSQNGLTVTRLRVATTENWRDRQSGEAQSRTEWHSVVCFQRLAEIARDYLKKGSRVYIEGSLRTDSWEAPDGQRRYRTEIRVRELMMLDSRGGASGSGDSAAFGPDPLIEGSQDNYSQENYKEVSPVVPERMEPDPIPVDKDPEDDIPF